MNIEYYQSYYVQTLVSISEGIYNVKNHVTRHRSWIQVYTSSREQDHSLMTPVHSYTYTVLSI